MEKLLDLAIHLVADHKEDTVMVMSIVLILVALWVILLGARSIKQAGQHVSISGAQSGAHIDRLIKVVEDLSDSLQESTAGTMTNIASVLDKLVDKENDNAEALQSIDAGIAALPDDVVALIKPELKILESDMRASLREAEARIIKKITEVIRGEDYEYLDLAAGADDRATDDSVRAEEPTAGEV